MSVILVVRPTVGRKSRWVSRPAAEHRERNCRHVYLTEGVSRLSRDKDRILPYELLRLLKKHSMPGKNPEGVWNPVIDRGLGISCR